MSYTLQNLNLPFDIIHIASMAFEDTEIFFLSNVKERQGRRDKLFLR